MQRINPLKTSINTKKTAIFEKKVMESGKLFSVLLLVALVQHSCGRSMDERTTSAAPIPLVNAVPLMNKDILKIPTPLFERMSKIPIIKGKFEEKESSRDASNSDKLSRFANTPLCNNHSTNLSGTFESPGWPESYPNSINDCIFRMKLEQKDYSIRIKCEEFLLQPKNETCSDYLLVNGDKYCGRVGPDLMIPEELNISFYSDDRRRYPGFKCRYWTLKKNGYPASEERDSQESETPFDEDFNRRCGSEEDDGEGKKKSHMKGDKGKEQLENGLWSGLCGDSPIPSNRIVGGIETEIHQYPWMVSVFKPCDDYGVEYCHVCGGTIISEIWILTAAHCVDKLKPDNVSVILGDHNLQSISQEERLMKASRVIVHPDYNIPTILNNDIGLVQLKKRIPFSKFLSPLCLPGLGETGFGTSVSYNTTTLDTTGLMVVGKNATIIGWGVLNDKGDYPTGLREVKVKVMDNEVCRQIYGPGFTENMMCTSGKNEKGDCFGDSGGPALVKDPNGTYIQVGILSFGAFDGCELGYPSGQVFVFKFIDWIQQVTGLRFGVGE